MTSDDKEMIYISDVTYTYQKLPYITERMPMRKSQLWLRRDLKNQQRLQNSLLVPFLKITWKYLRPKAFFRR